MIVIFNNYFYIIILIFTIFSKKNVNGSCSGNHLCNINYETKTQRKSCDSKQPFNQKIEPYAIFAYHPLMGGEQG